MQAERDRMAKEFRRAGPRPPSAYVPWPSAERTVILADAYRDAEPIRGEGDAQAADIYAQAYGKDPEFYAFYRSMNAYREALNSKQDMLVLQPDTEFFKYFDRRCRQAALRRG